MEIKWIKLENMNEQVNNLFADWDETIITSCLQNVMGDVYTDNIDKPQSAAAVLGDFCFLAGKAYEELLRSECVKKDFIIMVPQNKEWSSMIEKVYGDKCKLVTRYATLKEHDVFDQVKLQDMVSQLPSEYQLKMIDARCYADCNENQWSGDLVSQYPDYESYRKLGIGVVIYKDGELVAGASSYSRYRQGIEIEIDTKMEYRRKGLATVCGAKLILECLKQGLYPSWDAQNKWSLALSEKFGYHFKNEYSAYEVW